MRTQDWEAGARSICLVREHMLDVETTSEQTHIALAAVDILDKWWQDHWKKDLTPIQEAAGETS